MRPARPAGHGSAWQTCQAQHELIAGWVEQGLTAVKIGVLLERTGVLVPYRTLARYVVERCDAGRQGTTVRVADGQPGVECQIPAVRHAAPRRHGVLRRVPAPGAAA